jgi:CheY-like chemotaxis protein
LLDISRITSGKLRLDVQRVELPVVIDAALEAVRPAADAKGVRVQTVIEPLVEHVHGDPSRLQQIIWNLVSNAVKFTPKGGRVQVVLARVNSHVEIRVSDTGEGIDAKFLPHLFRRFTQADASASREHMGLGLGLALVKQLTELHGGRVAASSGGRGTGATFVVELPLAIIHARDAETRVHPRTFAQPVIDAPRLDGLRVLIVDDENDALEMTRHVLEHYGASVATAASADAALAALAAQRFDVVLSDIGMPRKDGFQFIAEARRAGHRVPAAALTAFARSEDRTRALMSGYQAHVAKPVEPAELVATIVSLAARGAAAG